MGTALVNLLLDYARQKKIKRLVLHSTPIAMHMYDKSGFRMLCKKVDYVDNEPLEYIEMEYLL